MMRIPDMPGLGLDTPDILDMLDTLRKNLKLLRMINGMSQEDLASEIYLTRSTYSAYESGSRIPDLQTLTALAALYGITLEALVNCDLSSDPVGRIYLDAENSRTAKLLNEYESLSTTSKSVVMERLKIITEREALLYGSGDAREDGDR